ncbi:unnamed protein product [Phytomonas sp. Hart1]|nr:unnamed protein product [Phytomonas sp. Hart1]|eukprot:CCW67772.1 unnamed protein product [Phytomonas sp. isolate Hart1]
MSITGVFSKGRPTGHPAATAVLKYLPRPRVPWQPSRFAREHLDPADLAKLWGQGRYRSGPGNFNSGYATDPTHTLEDRALSLIPKHELAKFMPDISLTSKALVTPVSLMSARHGHRITHDLLHSYDPYVGRLRGPASVDHDNITVEDPNRVGLNAATLDCRGRIYRWLRRGPFFQEDHYFRRSTRFGDGGEVSIATHETPLIAKILRLARQGHLKAAGEEYRRITGVPPVEVYRAMTAACVSGAKLADAIAIFEDGNSRLFYIARDGEVLYNVMRCAIRARHRTRVMWVYNVMRGRYYENVLARAPIDPIWRFRIALMAMEFLLDTHTQAEARAVYDYLADESEEKDRLLDGDVKIRLGQLMKEALAEGKSVSRGPEIVKQLALLRNAEAVAPQVAATLYQRYQNELRATQNEKLEAEATTEWMSRTALPRPSVSRAEDAIAWLQTYFPDVDAMAILRLARFKQNRKDLMAKDRHAYLQRAAEWIEQLSGVHQGREEVPLPYLRKSRPSMTNPNIRVAWLPEQKRKTTLLTDGKNFQFFYRPDMRLVEETLAFRGDSLRSQLLAQQPIQREIAATRPVRVLHTSVLGIESLGQQDSGGGHAKGVKGSSGTFLGKNNTSAIDGNNLF